MRTIPARRRPFPNFDLTVEAKDSGRHDRIVQPVGIASQRVHRTFQVLVTTFLYHGTPMLGRQDLL